MPLPFDVYLGLVGEEQRRVPRRACPLTPFDPGAYPKVVGQDLPSRLFLFVGRAIDRWNHQVGCLRPNSPERRAWAEKMRADPLTWVPHPRPRFSFRDNQGEGILSFKVSTAVGVAVLKGLRVPQEAIDVAAGVEHGIAVQCTTRWGLFVQSKAQRFDVHWSPRPKPMAWWVAAGGRDRLGRPIWARRWYKSEDGQIGEPP